MPSQNAPVTQGNSIVHRYPWWETSLQPGYPSRAAMLGEHRSPAVMTHLEMTHLELKAEFQIRRLAGSLTKTPKHFRHALDPLWVNKVAYYSALLQAGADDGAVSLGQQLSCVGFIHATAYQNERVRHCYTDF